MSAADTVRKALAGRKGSLDALRQRAEKQPLMVAEIILDELWKKLRRDNGKSIGVAVVQNFIGILLSCVFPGRSLAIAKILVAPGIAGSEFVDLRLRMLRLLYAHPDPNSILFLTEHLKQALVDPERRYVIDALSGALTIFFTDPDHTIARDGAVCLRVSFPNAEQHLQAARALGDCRLPFFYDEDGPAIPREAIAELISRNIAFTVRA